MTFTIVLWFYAISFARGGSGCYCCCCFCVAVVCLPARFGLASSLLRGSHPLVIMTKNKNRHHSAGRYFLEFLARRKGLLLLLLLLTQPLGLSVLLIGM